MLSAWMPGSEALYKASQRGLGQGCARFCSCSIQLKPGGNLNIYIITGSYYADCFPKANFDSVLFWNLHKEQSNYYTRGLAQAKSLGTKRFVFVLFCFVPKVHGLVFKRQLWSLPSPEAVSAPLWTGSVEESWKLSILWRGIFSLYICTRLKIAFHFSVSPD